MKREFTFDESMKIWIDYMINQVVLNNDLLEFPLRVSECRDQTIYKTGKCDNGCVCEVKGVDFTLGKNYPVLGVNMQPIKHKHKIRSFEDFCNEKDSRVSEGVYGWYWRFKERFNF